MAMRYRRHGPDGGINAYLHAIRLDGNESAVAIEPHTTTQSCFLHNVYSRLFACCHDELVI